MTADIVSAIQSAMLDDDENQSERLLDIYEATDDVGKVLIDEVLICLCGYSMTSLIARAS